MSDPLRDFPPLPPEVRASLIAEMGLAENTPDEVIVATLGELLMDLCRMFAELLVEMVNNPEIAEFFVDQVRLAKKWEEKAKVCGGSDAG